MTKKLILAFSCLLFVALNTNAAKTVFAEDGHNNSTTVKFHIIFNQALKTGANTFTHLSDIEYPETASTSVYQVAKIKDISLEITQGGTAASYTLTTGNSEEYDMYLLNYYLNYTSIATDITSSTYFKGYYDPLSSATDSRNVYYYSLNGIPTTSATKYYKISSVTDDSEFYGQYVHYYTASTSNTCTIAASASAANIKVAYDRASATFTVKATEGCPVGTYTVYIGMARRYKPKNSSTRTFVAYFPITITVAQSIVTDITLADNQESYEQLSGIYNVTLQRSLPTGKWLTFCAPFNIYSDEWERMGISAVRELDSVEKSGESITVNFTEVTDGIMVGIPYIIQMSEAKSGITKNGTAYGAYDAQPTKTVHTGDESVTVQMVGTYVQTTMPIGAYYISDDTFYHTTQAKTLKGWRAYFIVTSTQEVKGLGISFDDTPTLIEDMELIVNDRVDVYTLTGTKVKSHVERLTATDHLPAGIYIVGNKKVIVK